METVVLISSVGEKAIISFSLSHFFFLFKNNQIIASASLLFSSVTDNISESSLMVLLL